MATLSTDYSDGNVFGADTSTGARDGLNDITTQVNTNTTDISTLQTQGISKFTEDLTEASTTNEASFQDLKTISLTGGTYSTYFWIIMGGKVTASGSGTYQGSYRFTVGGTSKHTWEAGATQPGDGDRWMMTKWIASADADWTPANTVELKIQGYSTETNGATVSVDYVLIVGI